jgi:hypothetical protein
VSFVGLSVGFPRYARSALRFFVYLEAHCAFLIYITLLIKKKSLGFRPYLSPIKSLGFRPNRERTRPNLLRIPLDASTFKPSPKKMIRSTSDLIFARKSFAKLLTTSIAQSGEGHYNPKYSPQSSPMPVP